MKTAIALPLLFLVCCTPKQPADGRLARVNPMGVKMKLVNGKWFDGEGFEERDMWVYNGLLYSDVPHAKMDTTIDLSATYVIPPFGEAHNHNLESAHGLPTRIRNYLDHGVYYVKHLSAIKKQLQPLMHLYNKPDGLDISTTYAPLTGSGGHPIALRERFFDLGFYEVFSSKKDIESHGYFIIDTETDLARKWGHILSFKPEFIKINLLYSEEYMLRKSDTAYFGKKGMDPALVEKVVLKAHEAGLRVSAHVETAYDFHVAVEAGVDEIAHLPEIDNGEPIAIDDVRKAKAKKTIVVTTASLIQRKSGLPNYEALVDNIRANLELLSKEGVILAIGSDNFNGNSSGEFEFLKNLDIFTNQELLNMWTVNASRTIFPNRKIGLLCDGYEASFLVLDKNPLKDISGISEHIVMRVKQGVPLK